MLHGFVACVWRLWHKYTGVHMFKSTIKSTIKSLVTEPVVSQVSCWYGYKFIVIPKKCTQKTSDSICSLLVPYVSKAQCFNVSLTVTNRCCGVLLWLESISTQICFLATCSKFFCLIIFSKHPVRDIAPSMLQKMVFVCTGRCSLLYLWPQPAVMLHWYLCVVHCELLHCLGCLQSMQLMLDGVQLFFQVTMQCEDQCIMLCSLHEEKQEHDYELKKKTCRTC